VGSNEVFRDPVVEYASKLWAADVSAELHVWPGAFHSFDALFPQTPVSSAARLVHESWIRRILDLA
jgi:acetyl esterase/lipase